MTSDKVLEILTNNAKVISGKEIGEMLNISRVAVNKSIVKLRQNGVAIESTKKGYRLIDDDVLTKASLTQQLSDAGIDYTLYLENAESTNIEAKKIMASQEGNFLVVAPTQHGGKGRNGRQFASHIGGVYMTLCYAPHQIQLLDSLKIVLLTGLAVAETLAEFTDNVEIKWPNDVYVNGKKICGILLESVLSEATVSRLILGIGVNVNNDLSSELLGTATTLNIEGVRTSRSEIITRIISRLSDMIRVYEQCGFEPFERDYINKCRSIGRIVTVTTPNGIIEGKGIGLSSTGYLLVENNDGITEVIVGDVGL